LRSGGWKRLEGNPDVEVKLLKRNKVNYLLARSRPQLSWSWDLVKYRTALRADGAYLLRSNQSMKR